MASPSSSLSVILDAKYDVFLSFRGEDTRDNFTSHLYAALCRKKIPTFIDDDGLKTGDELSPTLLEAIEESKISVIIFSKNYASSTWCLDELVKILECREKNGQLVLPVFYHVNPSDVRKQIGSFKDDFVKHEKIFKKTPEKVQRWREVLTVAANLSGRNSMVIKPDSKLVDEVVEDILNKLNDMSTSSDCEGLVGVSSRIEKIKSLLCIELPEFRILGFWGMGGVGKTAIAGVVFKQISNKFESSCFIANVREEYENGRSYHLRDQLLRQLLKQENLKIGDPFIPEYIMKRLKCTKVFIVLDDVNDIEQLEFLIKGIGRLGQGSRVIITTRDKQVLDSYGVDAMYEVQGLKKQEALQLFSEYAFRQKYASKDFSRLSKKVVDYAKGNPLVLKVLGSSLYLKSVQDWESILCKLKSIPNRKIYNLLKISYDELDSEEQNIFLDIACFFKGENNNHAIEILNGCYFAANVGLSTLINKSLITRSADDKLDMHDVLQEMGWKIICQEKEPGKRSRLWNHDDIFHVLKNNTGTDVVKGLFLDMCKIPSLHLSSEAFENMPNLRFLKFYASNRRGEPFLNISKVHLPQGLKYLSNELRYLHWHGYPLKTLPTNFSPKNLVVLELPFSKVDEQLWAEKKDASDFKSIELYQSDAREREHCQSFLYIPSSIQYLSSLSILNLSYCRSITSFRSNIHFRSLITLHLSNCSNLSTFPQISGNIKELYLDETAIDEVPSSIACLTELDTLILWGCKRLKSISTGICKLKSLQNLSLWGCTISKSQLSSYIPCWKELQDLDLVFCNITEIPDDICCLSSLEYLNLSENKFKSLPTTIKQLSQLRNLNLSKCSMLQSIPELPLSLRHLDARNCGQLQSIAEPPSNLEELGGSEQEIVSAIFCTCTSSGMKYELTNCQKLKYNSQQIIQHMATLAVRTQQIRNKKVFTQIPLNSLILPGSEIPDWFSHQSLESSISIEVPHRRFNEKLVVFALSAVIAFEKSDGGGLSVVICRYYYGNSVKFKWRCLVFDPESDHIIVVHTPCIDLTSDSISVSFEFSLYDYRKHAETGLKVKSCGVRPLYVQPNMTSEDLGETELADSEDLMKLHDANTSEINENGNGRSNEVEVEPNANRYCSFRASCLSLFYSCFLAAGDS